jgi:hypothetical protein
MCKKQTHKLDTHGSSYKLFESKCIYIRRGDERELNSCPEIQIPGGEEAQQSFSTNFSSRIRLPLRMCKINHFLTPNTNSSMMMHMKKKIRQEIFFSGIWIIFTPSSPDISSNRKVV